MGKSSSSRTGRAESEVSSRSERRRTQDETEDNTSSRRRSQADSVASSNSRRRSHRKDEEREAQDESRSYRYTSQDHTGSNASYYQNGARDVDGNDRTRRDEPDQNYRPSKRDDRRDSLKSSNRSEKASTRALDEDLNDRKDSDRPRRRDSKRDSTTARRSDGEERSRAFGDHDASLPQNQFPGSFPDTNSQPYRPPGQAADYYGDQGESVQFQPGVRPQGPAFVTSIEQAHLHEPTVESAPPPEPSSLGQVGAAASYFGGGDSDNNASQYTTSSRPPATASPKSKPTRPGSMTSNGTSMATSAAAAGMAAGATAHYLANNDAQSSSQSYQYGSSYTPYQASSQYTSYQGDTYSQSSPGNPVKPSGSSSNYTGMAAAGLAGAAAAGYYAHQHHHNHEHEHEHGDPQYPYPQGMNPNFVVGQGQSAFPGMQQQLRHKHRGPLTKLADWFRDPQGVSQFEQYSEATGICKYCFDPNSTAADAPRKHYYHKPRPQPQSGRYGAANRIEKPYRHSASSSSSSSSEDEKRKRKRSSTASKVVAGGIAAYGAAKVGEAVFNQRNNFDDTYSVKSGQHVPTGSSQVTVNRVDYEDADMYGTGSRRRSSKGSRSYGSEDVDLRRKSSTSSRRSRRDEEVYSERKRSSKRRGSSSSPSRRSRGTAMSVGAAAGAAGVAALAAAERRRSRSRSRSRSRERSSKLNRKRSYYSKRVSPRHSYVDLSTKTSGAVGFGQFFSSPSANEKKGRRKGFFTWNNDSSSSSDADLAFGEGTVRRKGGKQEKTRKSSSGKIDDTAAILGLAATGAALAAESDRRKSKSRHSANDVYIGRESRRLPSNKIQLQEQGITGDVDGDGAWEDASDDDMSSDSIDTALAYGGRLSNRNSRESLAEQGTSKWAWRWTPNKEKQASKERRKDQSSYYPQTPPHRDTYDLVSTGLAGAAGAGVAATAANYMRSDQPNVASATPSPLPPMQFVEPFAASDPNLYEARRVSKNDGPSPHTFVSRSPAPLQQPQAVNAPSIAPIPVVLNKLENDARLTDSPTEIESSGRKLVKDSRAREESVERTRTKRRNSSPPPVNPSNISRNSVSWDLTDEQLENEKRALDKQEKRRRRRREEEEDRRRSADFSTPERKIPVEDRASDSRKDSLERNQDRRSEIDRELQALYAEHKRQMEEQKMLDEYRRSHGESGGIAAAVVGAGVGAAASAMINDSKKSSESDSDKKPRRKSSLKKSSVDDTPISAPVREPSPPKESQQERIAKMAAQRKKNSSSPAHDDYAAFFLPEDVAEHVKEHNDAAEKRERDREVIEFITPEMLSAGPKQNFDTWLYSPYRPGRPHQPDYHPRGVPKLELIEATPPGSPGGSRLASSSSPRSQSPVSVKDVDVATEPLDKDTTSPSSSSKEVKWGDNRRHIYEVETPEYERNDPTGDLPRVRTIDDDEASRISRNNRETETQSEDKKARDKPKVKQSIDEDRSADPSPITELDQEDMLGGHSYQKPFYESISDVGEPLIGDEQHRDVPKTGHGFAVPLPDSPVEEKRQPKPSMDTSARNTGVNEGEVLTDEIGSDARPSRIERRRLERAMSSSENVTPVIRAPEPEPQSTITEQDGHKEADVDSAKQMPGSFEVFDYLVDDEGKEMSPEAKRQIEASYTSTLSRQSRESSAPQSQNKSKDDDEPQFSKPKRAATFGDIATDKVIPKSGAEYASDPEDWERSAKKSRKDKASKSRSEIGIGSRDAFAAVAAGAAAAAAAKALKKDSSTPVKDTTSTVEAEPDYYASSSKDKKKRRSKRESEIFEDYDNKSVVSLPATKDEDRKSRRRSKRDSEIFDDDNDDLKSVASMPATKDEDSKSKRRSRDKEKEQEKERRSSGIFGGIFSSNKSDVSSSSKKSSKSSRSETRGNRDEDGDREKRRKRRSKSADDYEEPISIAPEESARSERHHNDSLEYDGLTKSSSRDAQVPGDEDGFVSADDGHATRSKVAKYNVDNDEEQPFLARGLEMPQPTVTNMPMVTDGVSGQILSERQTSDEKPISSRTRDVAEAMELPPLPDQDDAEKAALAAIPKIVSTPSTERVRTLPGLRTQDGDPTPVIMSSPTAVPLPFGRRGPFTPGSAPRSVASPSHASPLTTPRTRMNRPKSTSGKDFKPLYLVERHSYQKAATPEVEETFPSLPSSRTSSANPSIEDLRSMAGLQIDTAGLPERGRRHSFSSIDDLTERRQSPDYLGSRAATPVPGDKQKAREREIQEIRERKEKEHQWKSLFHSPSELLQDPALNREVIDENVDIERVGSPLPSVVSTDHDQEFMSAESRPESPVREISEPRSRQSRPRSASRERGSQRESISPRQQTPSENKLGSEVAAITGLGIAGGVITALSGNHSDNQSRDVSARTDDYFPEPSSGKKSKKDKKNKRKTIDLTDSTFVEEPTTFEPKLNDPQEPIISSKKSKKDKKKGKNGKTSDTGLPAIDIAAAQNVDVRDLDEPPTAVPALDREIDVSHEQDSDMGKALAAALATSLARDHDVTAKQSQTEPLMRDFEAKSMPPTGNESQPLLNEERFVPTFAQINEPDNHLGAFEEAFERAIQARGLNTDVTREDALQLFLARRENAPFIPKPELTPVPEGSPASVVTPIEETGQQRGFDQVVEDVIKRKLSKKEKRKAKKGNLSTPETAEDSAQDGSYEALSMKNPFGDDFDIKPRGVEDFDKAVAPDQPVEIFETAPLELTADPAEQDKSLQQEPLEADAEEFFSVPSKKDKKKKRKSQATAILPDTSASTDIEPPVKASSIEASREVTGASTPADEEWDEAPTKKGKKSKKSKKSQANLDWTDVAAIAAAGAIGGAVATDKLTENDVAKDKEVTGEPREVQNTPVVVTSEPVSTEFVETEASTTTTPPEATADDFATVTGKKSKKDKKKKSRSSAFDDWTQEPEPASTSKAPQDDQPGTVAERSGTDMSPTSKEEAPVTEGQHDKSIDDPSAVTQASVAETEFESLPLSRKISKKEKKKNKRASVLKMYEEPSQPSGTVDALDENLNKDLATEGTAAPVTITSDIKDSPDQAKEHEQGTRELQPDKISNGQPAEDEAKNLDKVVPAQTISQPPRPTQTTQSSPASSASQVPPNPFAVNLSMADAIALSMGQNVAALTAAKPKKKKKAVAGQGSSWTMWKPVITSVDEEKAEPAHDRGLVTDHEAAEESTIVQPVEPIESLKGETTDATESTQLTHQADLARDINEQPLSENIEESFRSDDVFKQDELQPEKDVDQTAPQESDALEANREAGIDDFEVPKKSKKDKKKARKSLALTTEGSEPVTPAENANDTDQPVPAELKPVPLTQELAEVQDTDARAEQDARTFDEPEPEPEPDQSWSYTTKKSKKDKKKRKSIASGLESSEPGTPAEESTEAELTANREQVPFSEEPATIETEQIQPESETQTLEDPEVGESWSYTTKRSKKDKKKRKSTVDTEDAPIPVEEAKEALAQTFSATDDIPAVEPGTSQDAGESSREIQSAEVFDDMPVDEWTLPPKKSKKDKKKGKSAIASAGLASLAGAAVIASAQDQVPPDAVTTADSNALPPTDEQLQETESHEAIEAVDVTPAEDEWAIPVKQSKKDKKKNRQSAVNIEEPVIPVEESSQPTELDKSVSLGADTPATTSAILPTETDQSVAATQIDEPSKEVVEVPEDSEWSIPVKLSKKDKKKKKKAGLIADLEDSETLASTATATEDDTVQSSKKAPVATEAGIPDESADAVIHQQLDRDTGAPAIVDDPVQNEDDWDFTTTSKKKKDKKKKKETADIVAQAESDVPVVDTTSIKIDAKQDELETQPETAEMEKPVDDTTATADKVEPTTEAADDEWASFTTKPSKKDKKKKRKSVATLMAEAEPESETVSGEVSGKEPDEEFGSRALAVDESVATTAMQASELLPETSMTAPISEDAMQDEWSFSTKPSKKDKKKKRKSELDTTNESNVEPDAIKSLDSESSKEAIVPPAVAEETVSHPETEALSSAQETSVPASQDVTEDEWMLNRKLSKKDKKKAKKAQKQALSEDSGPSLLIDAATDQEKKDISEDTLPSGELADKITAIKDRSVHELHGHDTHKSWLSQAHEAASAFPSRSIEVDETRDEKASSKAHGEDSTNPASESVSEAFDTPVGTEAEAEIEPEPGFAFAPTKKSKKDKRKNKRKSVDAAEETGTEDVTLAAATGAAIAAVGASLTNDQPELSTKATDLENDAKDLSEAPKPLPATLETRRVSMPGTFEDVVSTPEEGQGESVFASAIATPAETAVQESQDISWTSAFKKNKKDKKKRKSVAWSDADTSTPATPVNEQILDLPPSVSEDAAPPIMVTDEAPREADAEPTAKDLAPAFAEIGTEITEVQTAVSDLPTPSVEKEDYEWPVMSKKKSKKDKKRASSGQLYDQILDDEAVGDKATEATTVSSNEKEIVKGYTTESLEIVPETEAKKISDIVTESAPDTVPEEWSESSSKKKKKDKKKKKGSSTFDLDQPQIDEEDPTSKMIVDEEGSSKPPQAGSFTDKTIDIDPAEAGLRILPEDNTPSQTEHIEAGKPDRELEGDSLETSGKEGAAEPDMEEWALPGKKSKKDKKKKKREQSQLENDETDLAQAAAVVGAAAATTFAAQVAEQAATEQSGIKGYEQARDVDIPPSNDPQLTTAKLASVPGQMDVVEEDEWAFDTKKSKKDKKKKKRQSQTDDYQQEELSKPAEHDKDVKPTDIASAAVIPREKDIEVVPAITEPDFRDETEGFPAQEQTVEEEWAFPSKPSKKDKKKKRKSAADQSKATSADDLTSPGDQYMTDVTPAPKELPNYVRDFSARQLHDIPKHQEYLSAAHSIASNFPAQPFVDQNQAGKDIPMDIGGAESHQMHDDPRSRQDIESELAQDSDVGSNVSEETRERRRRRRSPPLMRDHDPEDLPTNRALTPPPDHDDIMDTALTIAAGLGFGESQHEASDPIMQQSTQPSARSPPALSVDNQRSGKKHQFDDYNRDSGVLFESPEMMQENQGTVRDSGFVPSPTLGDSWNRGLGFEGVSDTSRRPTRPQSPTSSTEELRGGWRDDQIDTESPRGDKTFTTPARRQPLPVDSASKERSSVVFNSSPAAAGSTPSKTPRSDRKSTSEVKEIKIPTPERQRPSSVPDFRHSRGRSADTTDYRSVKHDPVDEAYAAIEQGTPSRSNKPANLPTPTRQVVDRPGSPSKAPLHTIHEGSSPNAVAAVSAAALGLGAVAALTDSSRDRHDPPQSKSLGGSRMRTGSQRNLRGRASSQNNFESDEDAAAAAGTARGMSGNDVYDGYGSFPGSPRSPTRPPSVRKRQSMQQIKDLEARVDQLANENRSLAEAKLAAERHLEEFQTLGAPRSGADDEALRSANEQLQERDHELTKLRTEIAALAAAHTTLKTSHEEKHAQLETSSRELVGLKSQHEELSSGMEEVVKHEIATALAEKNAELQRLRLDLENARLKIRELQSQILARGADEIVIVRDEDYFENACQNLCQHVQSWVVRFSKFSDTRVCRSMSEVRDVKVLDRFDNALLDGSDIDPYLADRVKRRDVFMSVVMTMVWEYVFTRYLFGMDRDQRQKLKQLEKNLAEVGPAHAVHQWRALTLTLLSKRESFRTQCDNDTEAVVVEIMKALSRFLPPPQNLEAQISESLRKVMKVAVDLSIEMRTQRAEYIMLPPLQPEYDGQGDLTQKVYFNANLMNERSGEFESNEQLEEGKAVVRIVLFPLVVKKGDDDGRGDAEFVVCPAQVLVARPDKGRRPKSRIASAGSASDMRSLRAASTHSLAMSGVDMTGAGNMI